MKFSERGIDFLCQLEGFSADPYLDSGGALTIGYGHLIVRGERWDGPLTRDEARWILLGDAMYAEYAINELVKVPLTQNQADALICCVFNIGVNAFRKSTLLRMLNKGEYEFAARQLDRWVFDNGVKVSGLVNRRAKEKRLFLNEAEA